MNSYLLKALTRPESRTLVLIIACSSLLLLFMILAERVMMGGTTSIDQTLLLMMREAGDVDDPLGPGWFEEMARDFTALGGIPILLMLTLIITCYLAMENKARSAWFVVGTAASSLIVSTLLKEVFDRPRPDLVQQATRVYTSSFPSAHAMLSACLYLTFGALLARTETRKRKKTAVMVFAAAVIALVGLSRVYLGVHWPTDVLAGWTAGAMWTLVCWLMFRRFDSSHRHATHTKMAHQTEQS